MFAKLRRRLRIAARVAWRVLRTGEEPWWASDVWEKHQAGINSDDPIYETPARDKPEYNESWDRGQSFPIAKR